MKLFGRNKKIEEEDFRYSPEELGVYEEEPYEAEELDGEAEPYEMEGSYEEAEPYEMEGSYGEAEPYELEESCDEAEPYGMEESYDEGSYEEESYEEEPYEVEGLYEEEEPYEAEMEENPEELEFYEEPYEEEEFYEEEGSWNDGVKFVPEGGQVVYEETASWNSLDQMEDEFSGTFGEEETERAAKKGRTESKRSLRIGKRGIVAAYASLLLVIVAMVVGGIYYIRSRADAERQEFVSVGSSLADIELPGQTGLLAVADAEAAKKAAAEALAEERRRQEEEERRQQEEQQRQDYEETDYRKLITVTMNLSSIEKDLKIKFVNDDTGKLISNVPFAVFVTDAEGKTSEWKDDDMDGIIYKIDLTPGQYSVKMAAFESAKYDNYELPEKAKKVEVKKEIVYEKVDVSDEVKTEDEVDVSKEDNSRQHDVQVEEKPQDTVTWVDSATTSEEYQQVDKSTIVDPMSLAYAGSFQRLAELGSLQAAAGVRAEKASLIVGETVQLSAYVEGIDLVNVAWSSDNAGVAAVDESGKVTAVARGTATISFTANDAVSPGDAAVYSAGCVITVVAKSEVQLDQSSLTAFIGIPVTLNVTVQSGEDSAVISVESSDANVAVATLEGNVITVSGVNVGSAVITVTLNDAGQEAKAACAVTVRQDPKQDRENLLKDVNGNQVYVLENGGYREACYADYYTAEAFYIRGEEKHTGWQTIDGKVYYFDADGNKVTGEQVIEGAKYTFDANGVLVTGSGVRGIDVSKWNGSVDWKAVKNSGIDFVIIRCGYRGYGSGVLVEDPTYKKNIQGATAAGLKVGVYFFTQAISAVEAVEEASMVLERVKNYSLSYPIFLDVESSGGRADGIGKGVRTEVCKAFCETIQKAGYTAGIYANKTWLTEKIDASSLSSYKIWLAQYATEPTYTGKYDMWQYQSTGRISGISTDVDMNWSYME